MAGWFDQKASFDAQQPEAYDYATEAKRVAQQKQLAAAMQQQLSGGFTAPGGWYVA